MRSWDLGVVDATILFVRSAFPDQRFRLSRFAALAQGLTVCCLAGWTGPAWAQGMAVPGKLAVNAAGAATYTIPIVVPPGTAGMAPALALDYNSQGGNGLIGVGWSLDGLPSIGRCPRTLAQDGVRGGVNYDADDRFCLDGQRLMAISGSYGADGAEYRTEVESFSRVISRGTAGTGPAWFEVRTKTGQILEFGNTADSRILAQGKPTARSWVVNKVSDTKGNAFTVTYTSDAANGQAYPSRIDYTANAAAGITPYNAVEFVYASRPDVLPIYQAGSLIQTTQRLTDVKTFAGATMVGHYKLVYQQSAATGRSRVSSIQLCDGAATCLPATTFAWQDGSALSFSAQTSSGIPASAVTGGVVHTGDWNGDGRTDLMWYDASSGNNRWFINNGVVSGALSFAQHTNPAPVANIDGGTGLYFGDWNGDGRSDFVWWNKNDGNQEWFINNGVVNGSLDFSRYSNIVPPGNVDGNTSDRFLLNLGDWNGDGRTDVLFYKSVAGDQEWYASGFVNGVLSFTRYQNLISPGYLNEGNGIRLGDWNGDGRTDVLWYNQDSGDQAWFSNVGAADGTFTFTLAQNVILPSHVNNVGDINFLGDWNGDGRTDLLWYTQPSGDQGWFVSKGGSGTALSFQRYVNPVSPGDINNGTTLLFGDWNGDDLTDFMWFADGGQRWYLNRGFASGSLGFSVSVNVIDPSLLEFSGEGWEDNYIPITLGDWNGDGLVDVLWRNPNTGETRWLLNSSGKPDLLASVSPGLGATTAVAYKPLTDASVYTKDSGADAAAYPSQDVQGALFVVSRVDAPNGIGGTSSLSYAYAGAEADQSGRGYLGFREMRVTDLQSNIVQTTTYRQDYPYTTLVASETKALGAQILNQTTNTYAATALGGTRQQVVLAQSQVVTRDLTGTPLPTVTSSYQHDAFGNATEITVAATDGVTKTTTNTYSNDAATWQLGRLTGATVTSGHSPPQPAGCGTPWGGTLENGQSVTAYQASIPSAGQFCPSIAETRTCSNGTLSGSYTYQTCTSAPKVLFLTTGSMWTVPSDWNSANNKIESIGGGGNGANGTGSGGGGSGGGGAYSAISNLGLTPASNVAYQVGGIAGDTWFNGATLTASSVGSKAGTSGSGITGGTGGQAASGVGSTKYSGGAGRGGGTPGGRGAPGGGGAAGPHGAGKTGGGDGGGSGGGGGGGGGANNGVNGTSGSGLTSGPGGNNRNAAGGGPSNGGAGSGGGGGGGKNGGAGTAGAGSQDMIWTSNPAGLTAGPGGGGGGGGGINGGVASHGGAGQGFGSGGGGGGSGGAHGTGGAGKPGIIVITYVPI